MMGKNSKEFSTNLYPNGRKGVQTKEKLGVGGRCRKGRKKIGTTQCYQSYLLKGKVSHKGGRVCANCEGMAIGESDGVRSLFMSGLKDECFTCISNCEGEGVR